MAKKANNRKKLKDELLQDVANDETEQNLNIEWFTRYVPEIENLRRESIENVTKANKDYLEKKRSKKLDNNSNNSYNGIDPVAIKAYEKWKQENPTEIPEYPEISLQKLLVVLQRIRVENSKNKDKSEDKDVKKISKKDSVEECIYSQNTSCSTFSDSPVHILMALRDCLYTRNWEMMVRFLIILLKTDCPGYRKVVLNYCQVLLTCYPLVVETGLDEQFKKIVKKPDNLENTIVV